MRTLARLLSCAALVLAALSLGACSAIPPPPLSEDPRWSDLMRDGQLESRGRVYVSAPRLVRPAGLELEQGVHLEEGRSSYWPNLPKPLLSELRRILGFNSGYEIVLWDPASPVARPTDCDYTLSFEVTRYRYELISAGQGSAMAAMAFWGFPHLTTFYNAPDELYRGELRVTARLEQPDGTSRSRRLRATHEILLTDFQRGWTVFSKWPEQGLNWIPADDAVAAWAEYGPHVEEALEPHLTRDLALDLMRFLREPEEP